MSDGPGILDSKLQFQFPGNQGDKQVHFEHLMRSLGSAKQKTLRPHNSLSLPFGMFIFSSIGCHRSGWMSLSGAEIVQPLANRREASKGSSPTQAGKKALKVAEKLH
jgi:hypothetical protein